MNQTFRLLNYTLFVLVIISASYYLCIKVFPSPNNIIHLTKIISLIIISIGCVIFLFIELREVMFQRKIERIVKQWFTDYLSDYKEELRTVTKTTCLLNLRYGRVSLFYQDSVSVEMINKLDVLFGKLIPHNVFLEFDFDFSAEEFEEHLNFIDMGYDIINSSILIPFRKHKHP